MNSQSQVRFAPNREGVGLTFQRSDPGCVECHGPNVTVHTFSTIFTTAQGERVFRNCKPILNLPECQACHGTTNAYNGVLVTDVSLQAVDESLANDLRTNILWSAATNLATSSCRAAISARACASRAATSLAKWRRHSTA